MIVKLQRGAWVLTLGALLTAPALAGVDNGQFAEGLAGWSIAGDVSWQAGTAVLTNALDASDDGGVSFNLSGRAPLAAGGDLEAFAGLGSTALDGSAAAYEGSAMRQTFTVAAGDVLTFDWRLLTNEAATGGQPDLAFVVLGNASSDLVLGQGADARAADAALGYAAGTAWTTFQHTFTTAGTVTLAFGVVDRGDFVSSSALQLDNVTLLPVPEADGLWLALSGLGGLVLRRRRAPGAA